MATAQVQLLRPPVIRLATLKRRSEFLRTRKGFRFATQSFVLEARQRGPEDASPATGARFGFTISKAVGKAVERNRIKRRLKAAVRDVVDTHARSDFDYVLIARRPALAAPFATLVSDLIKALGRVHAPHREGQHSQPKRIGKLQS